MKLAILISCVVFCLVVGYASAGYSHGHGNSVSYQNSHQSHQPAYGHNQGHGHGHGHGHYVKDYYARPYYKYSYGVNDHYTYDQKHASEHRDGDKVTGHYALREPDGSWRTVNYVADYNGFRAQVHRTPNSHPQNSHSSYGQGH